MAGAYAAIIVGLILYNAGQIFLRRFGPRSRADEILSRTLKGLDRRYTLLAFPSTKLPDYILVGPGGIQVIVARPHDGAISCRANVWRRDPGSGLKRLSALFGGAPFGDPSKDVAKGIERVRQRLQQAGIDEKQQPPVEGVIVLTNPNAKLRNDGCSYPVTTLKTLPNSLRGGKAPRERGRSGNVPRERGRDDRATERVLQALTG
jgi:hypothetical protein